MRLVHLALVAQLYVAGSVAASPSVSASPSPEKHRAVLHAPRPAYPYEARKKHLEGRGLFVMHIDPDTGAVSSVTVAKSTGHAILDQAAVDGLSKWKFRVPLLCKPDLKCPIAYTMSKAAKASDIPKAR